MAAGPQASQGSGNSGGRERTALRSPLPPARGPCRLRPLPPTGFGCWPPEARSPPNFPRLLRSRLRGAAAVAGKLRGRPAAARARGRPPSPGGSGSETAAPAGRAAESTGGAPPPSLPRVPAQPGDGGGATSASGAARPGRSPGEEGEGGLKDLSERRERKESGGEKGGVWCHHAALRLRTLPGSAAAAAAVIYGKRREAGKVPRSPLLSLACTGRRPGTLGARDTGGPRLHRILLAREGDY